MHVIYFLNNSSTCLTSLTDNKLYKSTGSSFLLLKKKNMIIDLLPKSALLNGFWREKRKKLADLIS